MYCPHIPTSPSQGRLLVLVSCRLLESSQSEDTSPTHSEIPFRTSHRPTFLLIWIFHRWSWMFTQAPLNLYQWIFRRSRPSPFMILSPMSRSILICRLSPWTSILALLSRLLILLRT